MTWYELWRIFLIVGSMGVFGSMMVLIAYYQRRRDWRVWLAASEAAAQWLILRGNVDNFHNRPTFFTVVATMVIATGLAATFFGGRQLLTKSHRLLDERDE